MTKGVFYQEGITILNVYVANNKATKYIKQKLKIYKEKDKSIITVEYFNTYLLIIEQVDNN